MQLPGTALAARPASTNGNGYHSAHDPAQLARSWSCRKRDGRVVPFDPDRIQAALALCFESISAPLDPALIAAITGRVVNTLAAQKATTPEVEEVQRLVIQQLWGEGLFDAAEHYQNWRESRRRARAERPIPAEVAAAVAQDQHHFPTDLQYYQFTSKFARWREADARRETWRECVFERVMPWFKALPAGAHLTDAEWDMLSGAMYDLQAGPAMRVVQMAGPALDRCHMGAYNCTYAPIDDLRSFAELLYILMQGCGAGFSVESDYVGELPKVKKQRKQPGGRPIYVVGDSTEGWCDALLHGLETWFGGGDVWFDVSGVRDAGAVLKTKGGRSSGPQPLIDMLAFVRKTVLARQGKYLTDLDVHDIACKIGKIVQVGGVRRAACISLSDLDSQAMRDAKSGAWYLNHVHRTMANNSAVYDEKPPIAVFMDEWVALMKSGSGERGIFNREANIKGRPSRRKAAKFGSNPCGEIVLRPRGCCNLSIAVARPGDTEEDLLQKVTVATYFGVLQSTCTSFRYVRDEWRKNCVEERLLGVDITGHADCALLRFDAPGRAALLDRLKARVQEVKHDLAARMGIAVSAADTCVKPSGDSAVFFHCASGLSPWFAAFRTRWVRESIHSPVAAFLKAEGVPHAVAPEDPSLVVFGFPAAAPPGATLRDDMTAIQQLENWLCWKTHWAEHSVAATIYVAPHEWLQAGAWVYDHFDQITGLSFLPKDNGGYAYAPNEELSEAEYVQALETFPALNWAKLARHEQGDQTEATFTPACVGGACDL